MLVPGCVGHDFGERGRVGWYSVVPDPVDAAGAGSETPVCAGDDVAETTVSGHEKKNPENFDVPIQATQGFSRTRVFDLLHGIGNLF